MRPLRPRRPSPALVVSCLALLVALSGTGYAAVALPRNSVGTPQLRNGSVTSLKVRNGTLALLDFAASERAKLRGAPGSPGSAGPKGDKGDKGDKGAKGDPGLSGYVIVQKTSSTTNAFLAASVSCPAGTVALGGGGFTQTPAAGVSVRNSFPMTNGAGWLVVAEAKNPAGGWNYLAHAVCAKVG